MSSKQSGKLSKKKAKRRKHRESGFEEWGGYMAAKKQKLAMQFEENKALELMVEKETKIFEGVGIFVNGYTNPSANELKRLMLIHGGTYHHYHSSKVTHVIASNLPKSKMKLLKTQTFVTADWITHSIKAGKCLPHQNYLLYAPEIADKQQRLHVENYFQKKSHSSTTENPTVNESNTLGTNNQLVLEDSLEKNLESDCIMEYELNSQFNVNSLHKKPLSKASYQNPVASNHSKVPSPIKPSLNVNVSTSTKNQNISNKDLSLINISGNHNFGESNLPKKEMKEQIRKKEIVESLDSVSCTGSIECAKIHLVHKISSCKNSSNSLQQKHSSSDNKKEKSSPLKSSFDVKNSISAQNQSIPDQVSDILNLKCSESNHEKVSSPMKSFSNFIQNQSVTNNDSSHLKSSSSIHKNVSNIHINQGASNNISSQSTSAESHQEHNKATKAGDPNFLPEFFNHSRKHHISTSAQELKRYVQFLVESNKEKHFPKRERLRELARQFPNDSSFVTSDPKVKSKAWHVIMHLDMDSFFVSVGLRKLPELRGIPVAVTHSKGKRGGPQDGSDISYEASHYSNESKKKLLEVISGNEASKSLNPTPKISMYSKEYGSLSEVACCSYEARKAGVRNGLFLGEALRRCPNLQTIPYDFEGYSEVSKQLYDIVASYTLDIEAVSCDELYIDCTELLQDVQLSPYQFASILRAEIEKKTGCTASAGMGSNMLLARLATKVAKPNSLHYVHNADIENFMKQQKVGDLPGVGYRTAEKFHSLNVRTCEDMQNWSLSKLQQEFGPKTGQAFYNNCRGKDDRCVQYYKDRKSVSAEINYGIRFESEEDIYNFINELSIEVQNRIQKLNSKGKLVTLKLMVRKGDAPVETAKFMGHGVCDHISQSTSLKSATDSSLVISKMCCKLAQSLKIKPQDYRGVGIQLSKLEPVEKSSNIKASIFKPSNNESSTKMESTNGIFAPKNLEKVNEPVPEKSTITHFLSSKSSLSKHLDCTVENNPVKNISLVKQSGPSSKFEQKTKKTLEHFLSNKPSTSRTMSYNVADYLPDEIDESVLEAFPEDLRAEILKSCKVKSSESDRKSLNQNTLTSSASEQCQSSKSQELSSKNFGDRIGSNSLQSEMIGLDQSFLDALPDDLRKEVLDSYGSISKNKQQSSILTSIDHQPSTSFASKQSNPIKVTPEKNNSKQTKELSESVLNALPEDLRKEVLESYSGYSSGKTGNSPQPSTSNHVDSSKECLSTQQKSSKETSEDDCGEFLFFGKKYPTLGGVYKLDDVRTLIKEWIDTTDEPLEEDIDDLKTFLVELCDVELGKVEILSKYLYRLAKKANQKWKDVYLTILPSVQEKVYSIYQATLELSNDFPT